MRDLTGERFGKWTVGEHSHYTGKTHYWNCTCSCGVQRPVKSGSLLQGKSTSCGCKTSEIKPGSVFGMLTVVDRDPAASSKDTYWNCLCECGNSKSIRGMSLRNGVTKSCGCYRDNFMKTHGMYDTPTYSVWVNMVQRCTNTKHTNAKRYSLRGITVCESWLNFENFLADMGERASGQTLDRIDNDKGYCKENCRWTDAKTQMRNTRRNVYLTIFGETKCQAEWAELSGLKYSSFVWRVKSGWDLEKLLTV
jgi:hypothetical protein